MKKIDKYDLKIIGELIKNSRQGISKISKKVRRSKQFVDYRIKRLERLGVIKRYSVGVRWKKMGYLSYRILAYGSLIHKIPRVFGIRYIAVGEDKIDISVVSKDGLNVQYIVNYLKEKGFDVDLMVRGKVYIPFNFNGYSMENFKEKGMFEIDEKLFFKIVDLMERGLRDLDIANRLGIKYKSFIEIRKKLEGSLIRGYSCLVDFSKIGFRRFILYITSKSVRDFPKSLDVNLLEKLAGRWDYRIEIIGDESKLSNVLNMIRDHTRKVLFFEPKYIL